MRLPPLDRDHMNDEQKRVYDIIASGPRGRVRGPLAVWLNRPELAETAQALGAYCRYGSSLEPRLSELAILTMARLWSSEFEWWAHKPIALRAGLDPSIVEALRIGAVPSFDDSEAEIVYRVITTLNNDRTLGATLYDEALRILGKDRLVDLVGLAGYYTLISMTINAFGVELPDGEQAELA